MSRDKDQELHDLRAAVDRKLWHAQMPLWRTIVPAMMSGALLILVGVLLGKFLFNQ